jgi:excisionase family DNA binding protein
MDDHGPADAAPLPEFLTVEEAAKLLRINDKTLYQYILDEDPPWAMRFGRVIRISRIGLVDSRRGSRAGPALGSKS